jgi:hypothetical protein
MAHARQSATASLQYAIAFISCKLSETAEGVQEWVAAPPGRADSFSQGRTNALKVGNVAVLRSTIARKGLVANKQLAIALSSLPSTMEAEVWR